MSSCRMHRGVLRGMQLVLLSHHTISLESCVCKGVCMWCICLARGMHHAPATAPAAMRQSTRVIVHVDPKVPKLIQCRSSLKLWSIIHTS